MADLIASGFELMLLGMGIVFAFLVILIGSLKVMSAFASQFDAPVTNTGQMANTIIDTGAQQVPSAAHIAVMSAAIARFRKTHTV